MTGRRGASNGVLRAIGLDTSSAGRSSFEGAITAEVARCPLCRSTLEFTTDVMIGYTLERCTGSQACPNSRPHRPRPDPAAIEPRGGTRRRSGAAAFPVILALVCFGIGCLIGVVGAWAFTIGLLRFLAGHGSKPVDTEGDRVIGGLVE